MGQLHVRYAATPGIRTLSFAIERLKDSQVFDFLANPRAFRLPVQGSAAPFPIPPSLALPERFPGSYEAEVDTSSWPDGNYCVKVLNAGVVIDNVPCSIASGDDALPVPIVRLPAKATIIFDPS